MSGSLTSIGNQVGSGLKDLSQSMINGLAGGGSSPLYSAQVAKTFPSGAEGLISKTNDAIDCFALQKFSATLQAYMLNYAKTASGIYSVYR